ncbi:hypothetical protein GF382_00290 [Candidatus Falkowbacteria bacterium]|nr:hypothetical protein [Candidatus Falkowbacteria bacterium]
MGTKKNKIKKTIEADPSADRILEKIFGYAIDQEVSSILIDLSLEQPAVFYKIIDDWKKVIDIPENTKADISKSIKRKAGIKDSKDDLPVCGSFKIGDIGSKMVFQVSVNPVKKSEKIFIDLFKSRSKLFDLRQLGLQRIELQRVEANLQKSSGITLVLGGFDSGRTSTLYSLLDYLNRPELNIMTIEKEIDHDLPDINQICLDPASGFDHSLAIESIFKQDPDIIMIGDIFDKKTADNALEAAHKGFPVLAGLYSGNMISALQLLKDLDVSLPLFLQKSNIIIDQKVVKKICHHCISKDRRSASKIKELKKNFDWKYLMPRLKELKIIPSHIKSVDDLVFYKGQGCPRCDNTGFHGSIGVYELLEVDESVKKLISEGHISKIKEEVRRQGGFYIKEDALIKGFNGITTIDQILEIIKQ